MLSNLRTKLFFATAVLTLLLTGATDTGRVWAHPPDAAHDHSAHDHGAQAGTQGPHGGQLSPAGSYHFEVFYAPKEMRVYVYDARRKPVSVRGMRGEAIMRMRSNPKEYRFPLTYGQARSEDFLAVAVDVSRIRDGDMQVTFDVQGLPSRTAPAAQFTQTFALSQRPLAVTVARLTRADEPLIARQKICPVMDTPLGEHGTPIKLMVGDQPLYVCCKGCIGKVQMNPELYLRKVGGAVTRQRASGSPNISVVDATAADDAAIRAQGRCVVMAEQQLGGHGKPIKITVDGQSLFVCCKGCIRKVQQNPELYLAKARELRGGR